jgi:hypothetical protein
MSKLSSVYHGEHGLRMLKELSRSYLTITKDLGRVMNRLKALYRGWAIPCAGTQVYAPHYRSEWLAKIHEAGVRRRAELYYQQLDALRLVRQQARKELLAEARKHRATKLLRQIPGIGPLRAAHLVALMQTPHRFRTKRQLWNYSGLGLETHDSAQYRVVEGQLQRSNKPVTLRGLNTNHNHDLKDIFKGAAMRASTAAGPLHDFYEALLAKVWWADAGHRKVYSCGSPTPFSADPGGRRCMKRRSTSRTFACFCSLTLSVSSCATNPFSPPPKVILGAPHLSFQQFFFSPGWVLCFSASPPGCRQTHSS